MLSKKWLTTIFSEQAANGVSTIKADVRDFRHIKVYISTTNSADMTLQCLVSIADQAADVDFTAVQSPTNIWDTQELIRNADTTERVVGDTGLVFGGSDINKIYKINTDHTTFLTFKVSSYVAGKVTVKIAAYNNY
jgi:hypothetical protein